MKAYKGFDKNMKCRGFQYREGETYHEETADRIRNMTDEELVDVIGCPFGIDADICFPQKSCAVCMLNWLRSPVEGSEK